MWTAEAHIICLVALLSPLVRDVRCGARFELYLDSYLNPSGKEMDGDCCDSLFNCGSLPCDHDIKICLDRIWNDSRMYDFNQCSLYSASSGRLDNSLNNYFPQGYIGGIQNPIIIRKSSWTEGLDLKVYVRDEDHWKIVNKFTDVDKLTARLNPPVSPAGAQAPFTKLSIKGWRRDSPTTLNIRMRLYCDENYYGQRCDTYCYGQDSDGTGHYTCDPDTGAKICLPGWEVPETNCKVRADDCAGSPCVRGECVDGYQSFTCRCPVGYTGTRCETEINVCSSNPCTEHFTGCRVQDGNYVCVCEDGFTGSNCQFSVCDFYPCNNGGTCIGDGECLCPPAYTGDKCQTKACDLIVCQNGGTCVDGMCRCPSGYEGVFCEKDLCDSMSCPADRCEDGACVEPCHDLPCLHGGVCYSKLDGTDYVCRCLPGYTGKNCETAAPTEAPPVGDQCQGVTCENGGSCESGGCSCPPGFTGDRCELTIDFCEKTDCQNGGTCYSNDHGYVCICPDGDISQDCSVQSSCDSVFCQNGSTCDGGRCQCTASFTGSRCETQIGCDPNPCSNGGDCYSNDFSYTCVCKDDWLGVNCDRKTELISVEAEEVVSEAGSKYWVYLVIAVGVALVIFLIIIMALLFRRAARARKRQQRESTQRKSDGRESFNNPAFAEEMISENSSKTRRQSSIDLILEGSLASAAAEGPSKPPKDGVRTAEGDGSASEPTPGTSAASGYAYAKMDKGDTGTKTRQIKTPKNLEQKYMAMKAAVAESDLKK